MADGVSVGVTDGVVVGVTLGTGVEEGVALGEADGVADVTASGLTPPTEWTRVGPTNAADKAKPDTPIAMRVILFISYSL
ncbi:MAG: hypothetical protein NVSMB57_13000 [Actinomycetota bacterium]